jgi:hypothetical protein
MAGTRERYEDIVEVLDLAEYLPILRLRDDDQTEKFRRILCDSRLSALGAALARFDLGQYEPIQ